MNILAVIGLICSMVIGLWKFFGRKATERRQDVLDGQKLFQEGVTERDPSKITAGFNRVRNA